MTAGVSIGTAWSEAAAFVAREKRLLVPLALAVMVVPATVSQLIQPNNPFAADGFEPWMGIALLALIAGLMGQMTVSRLAMGAGEPLGATLGVAVRRLPATIGAFLLFFLVLSLVLIPTIMILTLAGGTAAGAALGNLVSLLALFGAAPRVLLAPALAMDRPLGPWALLKATWAATRGRYWRLLYFFLLFLAASLIFAMAVSSVIGSVATLALGKAEPMSVARLVIALASGIVQALIATIYAAMIGRVVVQLGEGPTRGI